MTIESAKRLLVAISALCFSAVVFSANGADVAAGKALYSSCASCHGAAAEGNSAMNAPSLNGQSEDYLIRQLQHFKSGVRGYDAADSLGVQMRGMASTLADEQAVADVSAYIASLPATAPAMAELKGDLKRGNNLYQGNCGACHGGRAEGNPLMGAPRLAGLDTAYAQRQVDNYKAGLRGTHADDRYGRQMKMMAGTLADEQALIDVLVYIQAIAAQTQSAQ